MSKNKPAAQSLKRAQAGQERAIMRLVSAKDAPKQLTTTNGMTIGIRAVSQSLTQMVSASVKFPERPSYTITLPGGNTQSFPHDEKSIEQTPEDKQKWLEYQQAVRAASLEQQRRTLELFILEGTDIVLPDDDSWMRRQERLGITIPEDETDRLIHYATTQVLVTADDQIALFTGVMKLVGLPQEEVDKIEGLFRGYMGERGEGDSVEPIENRPGEVVS